MDSQKKLRDALVHLRRGERHTLDQCLALSEYTELEIRREWWQIVEQTESVRFTPLELAKHRLAWCALHEGDNNTSGLGSKVAKAEKIAEFALGDEMGDDFDEIVGLSGVKRKGGYKAAFNWIMRELGEKADFHDFSLTDEFEFTEEDQADYPHWALGFKLGDVVPYDDIAGRVVGGSAYTGLAVLAAVAQSPRFVCHKVENGWRDILLPGIVVTSREYGQCYVRVSRRVSGDGKIVVHVGQVSTRSAESHFRGIRIPTAVNLPRGKYDPTAGW